MPKISCIMPVYNTAKYLEECIDSIINQTFTDFEFIISDDGSTDGSKEIIKNYAKKDNRIIFLDNPINRGICANLNDCLEKSSGDYIAIMESDDIALPERFHLLINFLEHNNNIDLLGSGVKYIDSNGSVFINEVLPSRLGLIKSNDIFTMGILTPTFMFRKKIIKYIGLFTYKYIWDYELYIKTLALNLGGIYNIKECLVYKRIHQDSTYIKNWKNAILESLDIRKNIIKKYKLGKVKYLKMYFLYFYLYSLNISREFLSKSKYYKKIYSFFRKYLNFGL